MSKITPVLLAFVALLLLSAPVRSAFVPAATATATATTDTTATDTTSTVVVAVVVASIVAAVAVPVVITATSATDGPTGTCTGGPAETSANSDHGDCHHDGGNGACD